MPDGIAPRENLHGMSLAGTRYLKMLEDLALEDRAENPSKPADKTYPDLAYGWQGRVGGLLGISQSHVSRLRAGLQEPSIDLIESAQRRYRIDFRYFHEPQHTSPHFREFTRPNRVPDMGYSAFRAFVELAPQLGIDLSESEKHLLKTQEWDGEPTPQTYQHFLAAIRTLKAPQTEVRPKEKEQAS